MSGRDEDYRTGALADAVGEAAGVAGAVVAAAIAGDVAAGSRRDFLNRPSAIMARSERRIEALLLARAPASPLIVALDHSNNKCTQSADRQHRERRSSSAVVRRTRVRGSGELSFSGVHFSKAEDFHKRPAYWQSSFQSVVDIGAM